MSNEDIFSDFMLAGYNPKLGNHRKLYDVRVKDLIMFRMDDMGCTVYYIGSGALLKISGPWVSLGTQLYQHSGDQILRNDVFESSPYLEKFLYNFTNLSMFLSGSYSVLDSLGFLGSVSGLCKIGTKGFTKYVSDKYEMYLPQFEYSSLKENIYL